MSDQESVDIVGAILASGTSDHEVSLTAQRRGAGKTPAAYVRNRRICRGKAALDVVVRVGRLEYRGYDSAGVAIVADETLYVAKKAGKIGNLEKVLAEDQLPRSGVGIGHTRWATHGGPNDINAHPHTSADGRIALVHNGMIENYVTLRDELEAAGIRCVSETDTEIVAQLVGRQVTARVPLAEAMRTVCRRLRGAFTLVAVDSQQPDTVVARAATPRWSLVSEREKTSSHPTSPPSLTTPANRSSWAKINW